MYFLLKYGVQADIEFAMVKRGVVDLAVTGDWTPATGDTKIIKDGANAANTTNNPAAIAGTGSVGWKLTLTATELQCARLQIQIVDSATKAVEDQFITVYTFGNSAAKFPFDFSDLVRGGLTALPNANAEAAGGLFTRGTGAGQINQDANGRIDIRTAAMSADVITAAAIAPDAVTELRSLASGTADSGSTTTMVDAARTEADPDYWKGAHILFTSGNIAGQRRLITGFNASTDTITFTPATTQAVSTQSYEIVGDAAVDVGLWATSAPLALVNGRVDSSVGAVAANAINDASVATDMDTYQAKVWVVKEGTTADHYAVAFFKNSQPITSGITSPTIQVIKASDGSDLIASTSLTQVGSTEFYKKDESTNKMVGGQIYIAKISATIDGSSRTWPQQVGRDSS